MFRFCFLKRYRVLLGEDIGIIYINRWEFMRNLYIDNFIVIIIKILYSV